MTDYVEIPQHILDINKEVTLAADLIFLNGTGFFFGTSRRIKFTTLEYLPCHTKGKLGNSLKRSLLFIIIVALKLELQLLAEISIASSPTYQKSTPTLL